MEKNYKLAGYRTMMSKTQKDMAKVLGITPQSYGSKENGKRAFKDSEKTVIKNMVAKLFPNITYEELFFLPESTEKDSVGKWVK